MNAQKLQVALPKALPTFDRDCEISGYKQPESFIDEDGALCITNENGDNQVLLDYYGEFRDGYPYIDERLVKWAEEQGTYWEWRDPGTIILAQ